MQYRWCGQCSAGEPGTNNTAKKMNDTNEPIIAKRL